MGWFRKAYSIIGALLLLQFAAQFYFIAAALFTIVGANDTAADVYAAFKNADTFAGVHAVNGDLIGLTILVLIALSLGSRYPRRVTGLTALLLLLLVVQWVLAQTGIPLVSALHGLNALALVGLGGFLTGRHWAFRRPATAVPIPAPPEAAGSPSQ